MHTYKLLLFLHFAGMIVLFIAYGLEWIAATLLRRSTSVDQARAWLRLYRVSLPVSGPGLLLLILTGGYMGALSGATKEAWIIASFAAIIIALVIGFAMILPRVKALRATLSKDSATLTGAALARAQDIVLITLIRIRVFLALGIVFLMTFKPAAFSSSMGVLLIAILLAVVTAAPARPRPSPTAQ